MVRREEEEEEAVVWCVWLILGTEDALVLPVNFAIVKTDALCVETYGIRVRGQRPEMQR